MLTTTCTSPGLIARNLLVYLAFLFYLSGCGESASSSGGSGVINDDGGDKNNVIAGVVIDIGDEWLYQKGTSLPPSDWVSVGFDDSNWLAGNSGIGYGDGDDATILSDMSGNYATVYTRKVITYDGSINISSLSLEIDYDDGFVAYINGQEVARANMPAGQPSFDTLASAPRESGSPDLINLDGFIGLIGTGDNVLAIEVHNAELTSSDLSFRPRLLVNMEESPPPTVSLSANLTSVALNGSTTLSWNSTDATGCTASGNWLGTKDTSGSETINSLTTNSQFTLTCSGAGGSANDSVSVTVAAPNSAPIASNVGITDTNGGNVVVGDVLSGSYTYTDFDGDAEGTSTFRWLRGGSAITGATASSYTVVAADAGQTITFEVTPVAVTGAFPGSAATSGGVTVSNSAPIASNVGITDTNGGSVVVGDVLSGSYTYTDINGDAEGTSTFRWLRGGSAITGATASSYTVVAADTGQTITFEVTPVAVTGASPGSAATSGGVTVSNGTSNSAPIASNVGITDTNGGSVVVGDVLSGSYTYTDFDGDAEGTSTFRWLRGGSAITGATASSYTVVAADAGQTITFEVTPVAVTGASPGSAATSGGVTASAYRTVVIIGDTQSHVRGGSPRYADFQAQIQWIIDNKYTENIDFVMSVGDLIDAGTTLPVQIGGMSGPGECDGENSGPYESFAFCDAESHPTGNELSCEALGTATTACYWYDDNFNPPDCLPCSFTPTAAAEWTRFDTQFDRLLPGGDTAAGIPFLLTKGNHDNPGNDFAIDSDREPEGWNQRYNAAFWDSLNGTYTDRAYEHVGQNLDVEGDSHSWIVQIGTQPVLVVSIPYISGSGVPPAAQTWAINQMTAPVDADKPAIVLVHHAGSVRNAISNVSEVVAPNLFLVSGGHFGQGKSIRTNGGETVLETVTDWTLASRDDTNGVSQNDYITLIRFYDDGTMEAFDYSVSGNARDSASANTIVRQAFDILPQ